MKKIFMSAALASLMMVGCQNEMIEGQSNDNGDMFTLEVVQGGSRTALNGMQTVWSNDDKIFVTSEDGKVSGVLHYKGNNKFAGHVFGGKTTRLSHVIFPVPVDGKVKLNQPTGDRLDLPMIGAFGDDKSTVAMANACALVNLPVTGSDEISLSSANANTLTGHYEYKDGDFIFIPGTGNITIGVKDNKAFFAAATDVEGEPVDELELKVGTSEESIFIPVEEGKISENNVPEIEVNENGTMKEAVMNVTNEEILQKALDQYDEVKLASDITIEKGIVIAAEKQNTLDLNGFALAGSITNNGVLIIDDSSEVYKRDASTLGVTTTEGAVTNVIGGTYSAQAKITPAADYSLVKDGENSVVLPNGSFYAYNQEINADANGKALDAMIIAAADGSTIYVTKGNYEFDHYGGIGDLENQTLTIVGLDGAKIIGTSKRPYGFRITSDYEEVVNIKNFEIECPDDYSAIYVKGNAVVNLYDLRINTGIHLDVASSLPTSSLCAKHTYNNGKEDVTTTWAPEGTKAVVNAYNVTSTIENGEIWADLLTMPCYYNQPYDELTLNTTTIAEFNYVGGDVKGAFANGITRSKGDNMFVNGIALPAYQAPAEDAE